MKVHYIDKDGINFKVSFITRTVVQAVVRSQEGKIVTVGHSVCNPKDEFDEELGQKIAVGRALTNIEVNQPLKKRLVDSVMKLVEDKKYQEIWDSLKKGVDEMMKDSLLGYYGKVFSQSSFVSPSLAEVMEVYASTGFNNPESEPPLPYAPDLRANGDPLF